MRSPTSCIAYVIATADDYREPAERIARRILELAKGADASDDKQTDIAA